MLLLGGRAVTPGETIWERQEEASWILFRAGHSLQELPAPVLVLLDVVLGPLLLAVSWDTRTHSGLDH